jgi:hypothetical protein
MPTFFISLRAFKHPLALSSIGLLLLNDHVLKAAVPSWLTGKLSDFAGLFFFPFLLAAILAFPLEGLQLPPRRIMALSCGFTALWFTLIKTAPVVNEATEAFASWLVGGPTQIVLDPTDLIALPIICAAWKLWVRLEQTSPQISLGISAYVSLGIAAFATMATAPCMPPMTVQKSAIVNNVVYLEVFYAHSNGPDLSAESWVMTYDPQHQSWNRLPTIPPSVEQALQEPVNLPHQVCDPDAPKMCYRITGQPKVEVSADGGQTWSVAWQSPWGRDQYMERLRSLPLSCRSPYFELKTYDIAYLPSGGPHTVVVAMGRQGVVALKTNGQWERQGIGSATPDDYTARDPIELLFTLAPENFFFLLAALATLIVVPLARRRRLMSNARGASQVMGIAFLVAGAMPFAWAVFVLWAYGVIPAYFIALGVSALIVIGAYVWGLRVVS